MSKFMPKKYAQLIHRFIHSLMTTPEKTRKNKAAGSTRMPSNKDTLPLTLSKSGFFWRF
jgi:hypothetical protein